MENKGKWLEFRFSFKDVESDVLVALLSELPFNSFMEDGEALLAYIERSYLNEDVEQELKELSEDYSFSYVMGELPDKDWNEEWESNFDPVFIDNICTIVAPFHKEVKIKGKKIILSPKMAFGTGHHHTTFGMISQMSKHDLKGKEVLDFGSGTGLLAIFASMIGAENILAIDIEAPSYDNMQENFELNEVSNATPVLGGKEKIPAKAEFDFVLANITANVILDSLDELAGSMKDNSVILFSGFFEKDLESIDEKCKSLDLEYISHEVYGGWVVAQFCKG